jgi:hypothetical protein
MFLMLKIEAWVQVFKVEGGYNRNARWNWPEIFRIHNPERSQGHVVATTQDILRLVNILI